MFLGSYCTMVEKFSVLSRWQDSGSLNVIDCVPCWIRVWGLWSGSVQLSSVAQSCPTLCNPMNHSHQASLSITNYQSLPRPLSIESVMPSNHLILCHLLLLPPSIFPGIRVFSNESVLHINGQSIGVSASASALPLNIQDWLPLGLTGLISLQSKGLSNLQHHSSKASILQCSSFFIVQLSYPYTTTGKTIALTRWTFVGKVMSLLFNMLSRLVIAFLPRNKCFFFISWLQ